MTSVDLGNIYGRRSSFSLFVKCGSSVFFSSESIYGRVGAHDVANMALNSMYNDGFFMFILLPIC